MLFDDSHEVPEPSELSGSEFEEHINFRLARYEEAGLISAGKYGVMTGYRFDANLKMMVLQRVPSLPDYEGVVKGGRQFIFDAKVCSKSSFAWGPYRLDIKGARCRQLKHLMERAKFGVVCFFLFHWTKREGKTFAELPETWAVPVHHDQEYWRLVAGGDIKSLNRGDCKLLGVRVPWMKPQGKRRFVMDLSVVIPGLGDPF